MFRTQEGNPILHAGGFYEFFDTAVVPLLERYQQGRQRVARCIAHHVISPELPPDKKLAFREYLDRPESAASIVTPRYMRRLAQAQELGCVSTRLQIAPGNRQTTPPDGAFVAWQRAAYEPAHQVRGAGSKITWWEEQKRPMVTAMVNGSGLGQLQELNDGITRKFPVGEHWAVYGDMAMEEPLLTSEVMYRKGGENVRFGGFHTYAPHQLDSATQRYIRFWRDVHVSDEASMTLYEATPAA